MPSANKWYARPALWLELFALVNLGFLGPDIYLAHLTNSFRDPAEFIPLYFSLAAPVVLLAALGSLSIGWGAIWRALGFAVGWIAVVIGIAGVIWHLGSRFFEEQTLESLVYTAPFAAPLAYTGIGFLLILNRMINAESAEWPRWVLLLALGGFVGNFIFSLADHAQNGFFHSTEWIPVASSAFAVAFLLVPFMMPVDRGYLAACTVVLLIQVPIGLLGFYFHVAANLEGPAPDLLSNTIYGAPPMAPLLLPNLVLLAFIGLWPLAQRIPTETANAQ